MKKCKSLFEGCMTWADEELADYEACIADLDVSLSRARLTRFETLMCKSLNSKSKKANIQKHHADFVAAYRKSMESFTHPALWHDINTFLRGGGGGGEHSTSTT